MKLWALLPFLAATTGMAETKPGRRTHRLTDAVLGNIGHDISLFEDETQLFYHRLMETSISLTTNHPETSAPSPKSTYSQNPTGGNPEPAPVTVSTAPPSPSKDPTTLAPEPGTREPTPDLSQGSLPPSQVPMPTLLPTPETKSQSPLLSQPPIASLLPTLESPPQGPPPSQEPTLAQSPPPSATLTSISPMPTPLPDDASPKPTFCEAGSMKFLLFSTLFQLENAELLSYNEDCELCYAPSITIDFENFQKGDVVSDIGYGISVRAIKIVKRLLGTTAVASPMIFDTSDPSGDDLDLGTPNEDFGGPGVGTGGEMGSPLENRVALGNVLIISENEDSIEPDDSKFGGTLFFSFNSATYVETIGLLDNDEHAVAFELLKQDDTTEEIFVADGGNNSFQEIVIDRGMLTGMNVKFKGSGAITHVNLKGLQECGPCVFVYKVCGFQNEPGCDIFKQQCEELVCSIRQQEMPGYVRARALALIVILYKHSLF